MTTTADPRSLLKFAAPTDLTLQGWQSAESQSFKFAAKYVEKCQEFNAYAKGLKTLEEERDHLFDFFVRNLITTLDNIGIVLQQVQPASGDTANAASVNAVTSADTPEISDPISADASASEADDTTEPASASAAAVEFECIDDSNHSVRALESVERSLIGILEHFGVLRINLLGQTYRSVEVKGVALDDPFEIVESTGKGKATELPVQEILADLWVCTQPGVRILRRGRVNC